MDATELSLAAAAVWVLILVSFFIGYLIFSVSRLHRYRVAIERQHLEAQAKLEEEERRRTSQYLHDEVGPLLWYSLTALKTESTEPGFPERLFLARDRLELALTRMEKVALHLLPLGDLGKGLCPALEELFATGRSLYPGLAFKLQCRLQTEVTGARGLHLYRIVQEVLWNTVKHARARTFEVVLNERRGRLYLWCRDDGEGFDVQAAENMNRLGLKLLRNRTLLLGGMMRCTAEKGKGTMYFFSVPGTGEKGTEGLRD